MVRAAFSFSLGFVAGVAGVLAYQKLLKRLGDESAEGLIEDLGEKMRALESRIAGAGAATKRRVRKPSVA